jgi:hypothetical protein
MSTRKRRGADAAVARHDRGHALRYLERHLRLRQHGLVVVRMRVDEAGRNDAAGGVDRLLRGVSRELADGGNASVRDADVGIEAGRLGAVDDGAAADEQVVVGDGFGHVDPFRCSWGCCSGRCGSGRVHRPPGTSLRECPPAFGLPPLFRGGKHPTPCSLGHAAGLRPIDDRALNDFEQRKEAQQVVQRK